MKRMSRDEAFLIAVNIAKLPRVPRKILKDIPRPAPKPDGSGFALATRDPGTDRTRRRLSISTVPIDSATPLLAGMVSACFSMTDVSNSTKYR